jgi:hypothetical protein
MRAAPPVFVPLLCAALAFSLYAEVLDRIAVTVEKQVIAQSDVIRYLRVAAFLDAKPVDLSGPSRRTAAGALVDQALMMADAADSHFTLPSAPDIPALLQQVKAQYPSQSAYEAALMQYQITEQDLGNHLLAGARDLRFADLRFRPQVQISDQDLKAAYDKSVTDWRASHTDTPPSFEDSRASLEKLLTDQQTMQSLDQWLETARMQKHVEYREAAFQ